MRRRLRDISGISLIELMAAMIIGAILIWGLVIGYIYGIEIYQKTTAEFQMETEGRTILEKIEEKIRLAERIEINETEDPLRSRLKLHYDNRRYGEPGYIEFFTNIRDGSLRMNYSRLGINDFNVRLLPITTIRRNRRDRFGRYPYKLKKMVFSYGDDDIEGYDHNPFSEKLVVRIDMALEDSLGNSVSLSSTQAKFR